MNNRKVKIVCDIDFYSHTHQILFTLKKDTRGVIMRDDDPEAVLVWVESEEFKGDVWIHREGIEDVSE